MTEVVSTDSTGTSRHCSLAVDSTGSVHIAWRDETDYSGAGLDDDIFYKQWNSTAEVWIFTAVVSTESTDDSLNPSLAVDSLNNVHVAWEDSTNLDAEVDWDIFYKNMTDALIWSTTDIVSNDSTTSSVEASLAIDSLDNVHIAWRDLTDYAGAGFDYDIFYKHWNITTLSWTTTEVVSTESTGDSWTPSLVVDSEGNKHFAWEDYMDYDSSGTDYDIFYKRWNSSTSSWITTEVISTESTLNSRIPWLGLGTNGYVHIVWFDYTEYGGSGTDADIFYKYLGPLVIPELPLSYSNSTVIVIAGLIICSFAILRVKKGIRKRKI
jgi:hypothetical protein